MCNENKKNYKNNFLKILLPEVVQELHKAVSGLAGPTLINFGFTDSTVGTNSLVNE